MCYRALRSAALVLLLTLFGVAVIATSPSKAQAANTPSASLSDPLELERQKFSFQKQLEERKLEIEWQKNLMTGGSLLIPLLLGVGTLAWQSRTTARLKAQEAHDAFELKAADIIFQGDSTRAFRNKARALAFLFPKRIPNDFAEKFDPSKFGGPRFEAKVEVFKAACAKVQSPEDVYRIWFQLFPEDAWIKSLVEGGSGSAVPPSEAT